MTRVCPSKKKKKGGGCMCVCVDGGGGSISIEMMLVYWCSVSNVDSVCYKRPAIWEPTHLSGDLWHNQLWQWLETYGITSYGNGRRPMA